MLRTALHVTTLALAVATLPARLTAQTAPQAPATPQAAPQMAAEAMTPEARQAEIDRILARLGELQAEALKVPELNAENEEITKFLESTMARLDASYPARQARFDSLSAAYEAAKQAQDTEQANALAAEANQLQEGFGALRERARQDAAVVEKTAALRQRLFERMVVIDPVAAELPGRLRALMQAQQAEPAGAQ